MGGDELAREERIALTSREHLVDEGVRRRLADQRRDPGGDIIAIEPFQIDRPCRRETAQFRQSPPL